MAIAVTNLGNSAAPDTQNGADASSYANSPWTPPSADNCIILLWVYNTRATNLGSAGTVSGNNLTWTQQATVGVDPGAQTHRLTCYAAISTGTATAGATTVSFGSDTQSGIIMEFQQAEGVDLASGLAGAIRQKPTNSSSSATSLNVNLAAAGDAPNRVVAGIGHGQNEGSTEKTDWTRLDDLFGSAPGRSLLTQWRESQFETPASASWTTAGAALGIAIELVAAPEPPEPPAPVVVTVTKGYVSASDTLAGSVATTSFLAGSSSGSDSVDSGVSATSSEANSVSTTDTGTSGVEAIDL